MKRSHSRSSYPFDKPLPLELARWCNGFSNRKGYGGKKVMKSLHQSKQRSYNKRLSREGCDL